MRLRVLAVALSLLSFGFIAHADTTVDFSGFNGATGGSSGDSGGSAFGQFTYNSSDVLTSLNFSETGGINLGGPLQVLPTEVTLGEGTPGTVILTPTFNGSELLGTLDFTYNSDFGVLTVDLFFNSDGNASGNVFVGTASENFSANPVIYTVVPPSVTPEPSSFVLFGTGLLGVCRILRRRLPYVAPD